MTTHYFTASQLIEVSLAVFQQTTRSAGQYYQLGTGNAKLPYIYAYAVDEVSFYAYESERELWLNHTAEGLIESASLDQLKAAEMVENASYPKRVTLKGEFEMSFEATSEQQAYDHAQEVLSNIENENDDSDQDFNITAWEFDKDQ